MANGNPFAKEQKAKEEQNVEANVSTEQTQAQGSGANVNTEKREARKVVRKAMAEGKLPKEVSAALETLIGTGSTDNQIRGANRELHKVFLDRDEVTEEELFKSFKFGRMDVAARLRAIQRGCEPAQRVWVTLDTEREAYVVHGRGEKPPKDFKGYVPPEAKR